MLRFLSRVSYWVVFRSPLASLAPPLAVLGLFAFIIGVPLLGYHRATPRLWMLVPLGVWIGLLLLTTIPDWAHEPWTPAWVRTWARGPLTPPSGAR